MPTPAIFDTAMAGLRSAQAGVLATSQNVAGANVEGYVRRKADNGISALSPASIELNGTAFAVEGFTRYYNSILQTQLLAQKGQTSYTKALTEAVATLDSILIDPVASVSAKLGEFFNTAGSLSNDPTSVSYRQAFIGGASRASDRVRLLADELANITKYASEALANVLNEANALLPQLAGINGKIKGGYIAGFSYPSPDLFDERDRITQRLQELVGGQTIINDDGTANHFVGGLQLVDRDYANSFANGSGTKPVIATADVTTLRLRAAAPNWGAPKLLPLVVDGKAELTEGAAGAYVHLLENFVPSAERGVDLLAASLVRGVNRARNQTLESISPDGLKTLSSSGAGSNSLSVDASLTVGVDFVVGARVFINGVDQGVRVASVAAGVGASSVVTLSGSLASNVAVGAGISLRLPNLSEIAPVFGYDEDSAAMPTDLDAVFRRTDGYDVGSWQGWQDQTTLRFVMSRQPAQSIVGMQVYLNGSDTGSTVERVSGSTVTATGGTIGGLTPSRGDKVEFFPQTTASAVALHPTNSSLTAINLAVDFAADLLHTRMEYFSGGVWREGGRVVLSDGPLVVVNPATGSTLAATDKVRFIRDNTFDEVLDRVDPTSAAFDRTTNTELARGNIDARLFRAIASDSPRQFINFDAGAARMVEAMRTPTAQGVTIVVTSVANSIATWQASNEANLSLEKSLTDQKESISGVNLDEEAANLVKYQQLYNASSKLLQAGRQMFDTLLGMLSGN